MTPYLLNNQIKNENIRRKQKNGHILRDKMYPLKVFNHEHQALGKSDALLINFEI